MKTPVLRNILIAAAVLAVLAGLTFIGLPLAWVIALLSGLWVLYRIARGWLRLVSGKGMPQ